MQALIEKLSAVLCTFRYNISIILVSKTVPGKVKVFSHGKKPEFLMEPVVDRNKRSSESGISQTTLLSECQDGRLHISNVL